MNEHDQGIIHSSEDPNWRTPPEVFAALDRTFSFVIDLAASRATNLCPFWYGPDHGIESSRDALAADWTEAGGDRYCFLNPPYSRTLAATLKKQRDPSHRSYRIEAWAEKCWEESQRGARIVALVPFAPQTEWYRQYVMGHKAATNIMGERLKEQEWAGHAAIEEWRLPHRISYLRADGSKAANAGVNTVVVVWAPNPGFVGPWGPAARYWSYR